MTMIFTGGKSLSLVPLTHFSKYHGTDTKVALLINSDGNCFGKLK